MKNIFVILFFLPFISCENGKDIPQSKVPSLVVNNFKTQFPNASDMEWETRGENYQIEYEVESVDHLALLDSEGTILKYKYELPIAQLPKKVKETVQKNYPGKKMEDAHKLKIGANSYFQVELEDWPLDMHKTFLPSGKENNNVNYWDQ